MIPTASLAAVLVFTGYKLVDWKAVKKLWGYGKSEVLIWVATLVGIVVTDLLTGVLVGVGLSAAKLLYTFSHLAIRVADDPNHRRTVIYLEGTATFVSLPKLAAALGDGATRPGAARPVRPAALHRPRLPGTARGLGGAVQGGRRQPDHRLGIA